MEKAREVSSARKLWIAIITYALLGAYMYAIGDQTRYLDATVPTVGFVIGGMGVRWAKDIWMKKRCKN